MRHNMMFSYIYIFIVLDDQMKLNFIKHSSSFVLQQVVSVREAVMNVPRMAVTVDTRRRLGYSSLRSKGMYFEWLTQLTHILVPVVLKN